MNLQLGRDTNGNKVIKVSFNNGQRGFSIQTNGNLEYTHLMYTDSFLPEIAKTEVIGWVKRHGTDRQRKLLGFD